MVKLDSLERQVVYLDFGLMETWGSPEPDKAKTSYICRSTFRDLEQKD
jgi:hypothetical protein